MANTKLGQCRLVFASKQKIIRKKVFLFILRFTFILFSTLPSSQRMIPECFFLIRLNLLPIL